MGFFFNILNHKINHVLLMEEEVLAKQRGLKLQNHIFFYFFQKTDSKIFFSPEIKIKPPFH